MMEIESVNLRQFLKFHYKRRNSVKTKRMR